MVDFKPNCFHYFIAITCLLLGQKCLLEFSIAVTITINNVTVTSCIRGGSGNHQTSSGDQRKRKSNRSWNRRSRRRRKEAFSCFFSDRVDRWPKCCAEKGYNRSSIRRGNQNHVVESRSHRRCRFRNDERCFTMLWQYIIFSFERDFEIVRI